MEVGKTTREVTLEQEDEVDISDVIDQGIVIEIKKCPLGESLRPKDYSTELIKVEDNDQKSEITKTKPDRTNENKFLIHHEEVKVEREGIEKNAINEFDFFDSYSVKLLQGAVTELERALRDSRGLIKSRDDEIVGLRKEIERGRELVHKEQMKWQRKSAVVEERNREIQDLKRKLKESEKTNEELHERIKEFESPFSESDGVSSCCSSMKELMEVKLQIAEKDLLLKEIYQNNMPEKNSQKAIAWGTGQSLQATAEESDRHNQLKLKFLRDAFFYFMIDFHSEEQIKAILAVLAYGDQREDVIMQAFRMRQRGKKFSVKEVSSRGLAFLHEAT